MDELTGRELDAAVARAMGYTVQPRTGEHSGTTYYVLVDPQRKVVTGYQYEVWYDAWDGVPEFGTDLTAAWLIVAHLRDQWTAATATSDGFGDFERPFDDGAFFDRLHRHADRRWPWAMLYLTPEAICKAFLAVGGPMETPRHD